MSLDLCPELDLLIYKFHGYCEEKNSLTFLAIFKCGIAQQKKAQDKVIFIEKERLLIIWKFNKMNLAAQYFLGITKIHLKHSRIRKLLKIFLNYQVIISIIIYYYWEQARNSLICILGALVVLFILVRKQFNVIVACLQILSAS